MATSFCSACGRPVPPGGTFCSACGTPVRPTSVGTPVGYPAPGASPLASSFPPPYYPGYGTPISPTSTPQTRTWELQAISRLRTAVVIGLVAGAVGILAYATGGLGSSLSVSTTTIANQTGTSSLLYISFSPPWYWTVYLISTAVVTVLEVVLLRTSLRRFAFVDSRFNTPATLALVAVIGFMLLFLGVGLFFASIVQAISCAGPGNPVPTSCLLTGGFWSGIALLGIGGLAGLIGYIGILIGIWRVGNLFGNALFKVGAVLLLIPFVGQILVLIGAQQEIRRLGDAGTVGAFL